MKLHEPGRYHLGDLNIGGSTYEYNHTVTGQGMKANQGWNAAIYAIWEELIANGKATPAFFEAVDAKLASFK